MTRQDLIGTVLTVLGPIAPEDMGVTMTHEHLLVDETQLYHEPDEPDKKATFHAPLTMEVLSRMYFAGHDNLESTTLLDAELAIEEAMHYKRAGGGSLVEASSIGLGRDPEGLARIARATGLHVIMGSSYYVEETHPPGMDDKSERQITHEIVGEMWDGVDGTGIRPGFIGEVGCSWPLTANEQKVLRASSHAQRLTGALLMIHPGRNEDAPRQITDIIKDAGANLGRTIMCHIDRTIFDQDKLLELAETGVVIEYDLFGHEHSLYVYNPDIDLPNDAGRLQWLRFLIDEGFGRQITVSQDCDNKMYLRRYGGCGYAHIVENVVPKMRARGFTGAEIDTILVDTPRRLFTFVAPDG